MKIGSTVEIYNTNSDLDGEICRIGGLYSHFPEVDFWILERLSPKDKKIEGNLMVMISSCLKEI